MNISEYRKLYEELKEGFEKNKKALDSLWTIINSTPPPDFKIDLPQPPQNIPSDILKKVKVSPEKNDQNEKSIQGEIHRELHTRVKIVTKTLLKMSLDEFVSHSINEGLQSIKKGLLNLKKMQEEYLELFKTSNDLHSIKTRFVSLELSDEIDKFTLENKIAKRIFVGMCIFNKLKKMGYWKD